MKHIFKFIIILFLVAFIPVLSGQTIRILAQEKLLTIEDCVISPQLYPERMQGLKWIPNTDEFCYVKDGKLLKGSPVSTKRKEILSVTGLNKEMERLGLEKLAGFPEFEWRDENSFYFIENNILFKYSFVTKKLTNINKKPKEAENTDIEKNTLAIAYTKENNLFISIQGEEFAVTNEKKGIVCGKTVHREEFGINKGTFWSPKGNYLAFYRMDESMVTDYPLVDINVDDTIRIAQVNTFKYPMAGMTSHQVTVGVYDIKTKKTIFLKTNEPPLTTNFPKDRYLTCVTWGSDENYIYIAILNREQNHLKLSQYNAKTGDFIKVLFEEKDEKYVEPLNPLMFLPNSANGGSEQFLWLSQRDGYNHLYLYNTDGKLIKQITKGTWVVTDFLGFSADGTNAFYISNEGSPIERHVYVVNLTTGERKNLTPENGTHNALISHSGNYIIDKLNSSKIPTKYDIVDKNGKTLQNLKTSLNPLADYKLANLTISTIKADDGTDLYYLMLKPPDFNHQKKYPVIVYVYGGPHSQLVTDSWLGGIGLIKYYYAQQGYIVFTLDNRGTSGRGLAFEQATFRNLGKYELADQMQGIKYLKTLPYIDTTRIGVEGWSYGGFMTILLMLKEPETFKVGVAGAPVIDWKFYEVMYTERYLDTPQENPDGYKNANLINYVKNLKGKLLIIHSTHDNTVVWQNSLTFIKACIDKRKQVDYFVYPHHKHNIFTIDRVHLYHKIFNYFEDYLPADK